MAFDNSTPFERLVRGAVAIRETDNIDWNEKHDIIFSYIAPAIRSMGVAVEWYDPDTTYEEDVREYVYALECKLREYKAKALRSIA